MHLTLFDSFRNNDAFYVTDLNIIELKLIKPSRHVLKKKLISNLTYCTYQYVFYNTIYERKVFNGIYCKNTIIFV